MLAQVSMWNNLSNTVFETGTLDGVEGAVNCWLLSQIVFPSVYRGTGACGVRSIVLCTHKSSNLMT